MSVVTDLYSTKMARRVLDILNEYPETRDNDKKLFYRYTKKYCNLQVFLHSGDPDMFYLWLMSKDVPQFESLTRCRRNIQSDFPELCGKSRKFKEDAAKDVAKWSTT